MRGVVALCERWPGDMAGRDLGSVGRLRESANRTIRFRRSGWRSVLPGCSAAGRDHESRCAAAHRLDKRRCDGQRDAVLVMDRTGVAVEGCVLHGAVLLTTVDDGRVALPKGPDGAAIEVFRRAQRPRS
jgi:hypothetical protein